MKDVRTSEKHLAQPLPGVVEDASDPDAISLASADKDVMAQMGIRQQLKRRFNIFTIFGLSLTLLSSWEAVGSALGVAFTAGGPVSLVYGLMFTFTGTLACAASIAEMASICPISGAQYHWTWMFAPARWKVVVTFIQGMLHSPLLMEAESTDGYRLGNRICMASRDNISELSHGWSAPRPDDTEQLGICTRKMACDVANVGNFSDCFCPEHLGHQAASSTGSVCWLHARRAVFCPVHHHVSSRPQCNCRVRLHRFREPVRLAERWRCLVRWFTAVHMEHSWYVKDTNPVCCILLTSYPHRLRRRHTPVRRDRKKRTRHTKSHCLHSHCQRLHGLDLYAALFIQHIGFASCN
jgi:hypothetical protein